MLEICGFSLNNTAVRIREQIERHQFVEGRDFSRTSEKSTGGRPKTVFQFTVNAANHVLLGAMTPEGKKARQKAIDREMVSQSEYPGLIAAMDEQFGSALPAPAITPHQLLEMNMDASLKAITFVKAYGIEGNQAMLAADRLVKTQIDFSPLEAMGQPTLIAPVKAPLFSVTELGKLSNPVYTAVNMNLKLQDAGMQLRTGQYWTPTEKGSPFCEMLDVGKHHGDGTPIKQLKWYKSVLGQLTDAQPEPPAMPEPEPQTETVPPDISTEVTIADPNRKIRLRKKGLKKRKNLKRNYGEGRELYNLGSHLSFRELADYTGRQRGYVVELMEKHRIVKYLESRGKYMLTEKGWHYGAMYDPNRKQLYTSHSPGAVVSNARPVFNEKVFDLF
ncbi:antA/AntB antirepressor family protein [Endozoicomonas sp. SCSIO W0465]|uniref:antA/AntB antirepressor family protein n=1 Tax=Endozoicomonas sp. SCSIO W0465 TaxID=2918516 RepID=UPI0020756DCC|nr:antA/AntB antirepressor family protein [Endozoicomonas sp. SCSIO W0465]USE36905.1 antA/AntB antirepressor family protein [Endozoicomonas sp. SCSIO W0465]